MSEKQIPAPAPNVSFAMSHIPGPSSLCASRLAELLVHTAATAPLRVAAVHDDRRVTYGELDARSSRLAAFFAAHAVAAGTRAAILYDNSLEYLVGFFGLLKAGLVVVPMDTSLRPEGLAAIATDCQAEVLLAQDKYRRKLPGLLQAASSMRLIIASPDVVSPAPGQEVYALNDIIFQDYAAGMDAVRNNQSSKEVPEQFDDASLAAIFYTSGSTGVGKGVMLSHRNLVSNTRATVDYLKLTADDSVLVILPFHYIYGNSLLLTHIAVGGTLVIDNRFLYPEVILDTMQQQEVTGFSGVPSNFQILLGKSTFAARHFPRLRYLTQAGGAMADETIRRLMALCPDKEIYIMYGQTEASPRISYVPPEKLAGKIGSVGIPVPGVEIQIVDDTGRAVPAGETGEVVVRGDNVMLGYWNQPEENALVLKNGWLHTGDLGRMDTDGYLYIVGREKEIIKCGGNRVSAKEIEDCLLAHPKVLEATVFGVADQVLGEAIKAVIVLKPGETADQKELTGYCKQKLADFKVPKFIGIAQQLPKYQSGKVNKLQLKSEHP